MKKRDIFEKEALKQLALLGAAKNYIPISSSELGNILNISQQSASNRIAELLRKGLIERALGIKKQSIKISPKGVEILKKEYAVYQKIFEYKDTLSIKGFVCTGSGEGSYYLSQKKYMEQFLEKLHFSPAVGTLNLRIPYTELHKLDFLKYSNSFLIKGFKDKTRTFGDVKCFFAKIRNIDCAVVLPERTHHKNILEIVSKVHLRKSLNLNDDDPVEVLVFLKY